MASGVKKHILIFLFLILGSSVLSVFLFVNGGSIVLEDSILTIMQNIAAENAPGAPDLSIDRVAFKKVSDPSDSFNYYRYDATIIIRNDGGKFYNEQVVLRADPNQKHVLVRNTDNGFTLGRGESFIVRGYDLLFDGNYNGGEITFAVDLKSDVDIDSTNNEYSVDMFEMPAKISSIRLNQIFEDGTVEIDFDADKYKSEDYNFELYIGPSDSQENMNLKYSEAYAFGSVYGYNRLKNSLGIVKAGLSPIQVIEEEARLLQFSEDPFNLEGDYFVWIKAVNPESGNYVLSNVLLFPEQEKLTRGEFAKVFVDLTSEDVLDFGSELHSPYVQTLQNLGLWSFGDADRDTEEIITRGEVLKVVMDYFDVDLFISEGAPHFNDIPEDHESYPYVEGMYASKKARIIKDFMDIDAPATKDYLTYLVNAYREAN